MAIEQQERQVNRFAIVIAVVVLVLGVLLALQATGTRRLVLVPVAVALAAGTYAWVKRMRREEPVRSRHQFSLFATGWRVPEVREVAAALNEHGYQVDAMLLDDAGAPTGTPPADTELGEQPVRLRDRRAGAGAGEIVVRITRKPGGISGLIEADDTGPGFYEEMAQFLIADLGARCDGLEYIAIGPTPERRPARALVAELPERPYGLALLS